MTFGRRQQVNKRKGSASGQAENTFPAWTVVELAREEVTQRSLEVQRRYAGRGATENTGEPKDAESRSMSPEELGS